jgi:hypothetical protein
VSGVTRSESAVPAASGTAATSRSPGGANVPLKVSPTATTFAWATSSFGSLSAISAPLAEPTQPVRYRAA